MLNKNLGLFRLFGYARSWQLLKLYILFFCKFNITSFFLERICITVVPWRRTFFSKPFYLMGATVSNVLEKILPRLLVLLSNSLYLWVHRAVEINQAGYL